MNKSKVKFVPITPGGSLLVDIEADTEDEAWDNLLERASHMPYRTKKDLIKRGYTVERWSSE